MTALFESDVYFTSGCRFFFLILHIPTTPGPGSSYRALKAKGRIFRTRFRNPTPVILLIGSSLFIGRPGGVVEFFRIIITVERVCIRRTHLKVFHK
jgi:hypothetical protein